MQLWACLFVPKLSNCVTIWQPTSVDPFQKIYSCHTVLMEKLLLFLGSVFNTLNVECLVLWFTSLKGVCKADKWQATSLDWVIQLGSSCSKCPLDQCDGQNWSNLIYGHFLACRNQDAEHKHLQWSYELSWDFFVPWFVVLMLLMVIVQLGIFLPFFMQQRK
jgi:hypothetical protein